MAPAQAHHVRERNELTDLHPNDRAVFAALELIPRKRIDSADARFRVGALYMVINPVVLYRRGVRGPASLIMIFCLSGCITISASSRMCLLSKA